MSKQLSTLSPQTLAALDDRGLGRQLLDQYHRATAGMVEYIAFGALALHIKGRVDSARGANSPQRGPTTKDTGLKAWLKEHAPDISEATAYRYIELAEGVKAEFKLGPKTDLYLALKASTPSPAEEKLRAKIAAFVDGKSQRQLLIGFGKFDARQGGARTPAGKKLSPEEQLAAYVSLAQQESVSAFSGFHASTKAEKWKFCSDAELQVAIADAEKFAKQARKWLETPKAERAVPDAAKLFAEEQP